MKPIVGIVSYSNDPSVIDLTRVVLPAFCKPTIAIYSYLLKNLFLIQSMNLPKKENMFILFYLYLYIKNIYKYLKYYGKYVKILK